MALTDFQMSYGGLVLGDGTAYDIVQIDGLELPDLRTSDALRSEDHGAFAGRDLLGERTVEVEVEVWAATAAAFESALASLRAVTVPQGAELPLTFRLPGQSARRVNCKPRRRHLPVDRGYQLQAAQKVLLQFVATDPRIYDDALSSTTVDLPIPASGVTFPVTFPVTFGASSGAGGRIDAVNAGNFASRPVATITGPVINPRVENRTVGKTVRFNLTLAAGDTLTVDFDARSITLNGTASRRSSLSADSRWWELSAATTSEIRFTGDNSSATASQLTLTWRSAWI